MKKAKLLSLFAFVPALLFADPTVWDGTADTTWYTNDKDNTEYTITTAEQLAGLAKLVLGVTGASGNGYYDMSGKTIKLGDDILLNDTTNWQNWAENPPENANNWTPIGNNSRYFRGSFDGAGYTISGMYINNNSSYQGLFGVITGGTISNLGLKAFYVKGGSLVGGVTGQIVNGNITITNVWTNGNVTGTNYVGGLVGSAAGVATISNVEVNGDVTGTTYVGGVIGNVSSAATTILNVGANGNVTGTDRNIGGLVGYFSNTNNAFISNSYAIGSVTGNSNVGGLVGVLADINSVVIKNSYSAVSFNNIAGDLVGGGNIPVVVNNSHYDNGLAVIASSNGLSTSEMQSEDFVNYLNDGAVILEISSASKWEYNSGGYPKLTSEILPEFGSVADYFESGIGSGASPYIIKTKWQLRNLVTLVNSGKESFSAGFVKLGADIELNDIADWEQWDDNSVVSGWKPIGVSGSSRFQGTFDGDGHTISGMYIIGTGANNNRGLFSYFSGSIKNLGVNAFYVKVAGGSSYAGGVIGNVSSAATTILNVWANGKITATSTSTTSYVGGLVGYGGANININNSYSAVSLNGNGSTRGLIGSYNSNYSVTIQNSYYDSELGEKISSIGFPTSEMQSEDFVNYLNYGAAIFGLSQALKWEYNPDGYPKLTSQTLPEFGSVADYFEEGDGTQETPYIIKTKWHLRNLALLVNNNKELFSDKYVALGDSIELDDKSHWQPIGINSSNSFKGNFDGRDYVVKGIYIDNTSSNQGLFGYITAAKIENIGVKNFLIKGGTYTGALIGSSDGKSTISNSNAIEGTLTGGMRTGGLIGDGRGGMEVKNSYSEISVTGTSEVGGLIGFISVGKIIDSYSLSNVKGTSYVGGLVGESGTTDSIKASFAKGTVVASGNYAGGLSGYRGRIINSYAIAEISGQNYIGGLIGSAGTVTNSYASSSVTGNLNLYALGETVTNSYCNQENYPCAGDNSLTPEQMTKKENFANWDFDNIWDIDPDKNDGMPYHQWDVLKEDFPEISTPLQATYAEGLTLANIELPENYEWQTSETPLYAGDEQKFDAIHRTQGYAPSKGKVTVNIAKAEGQPNFPALTLNAVFSETLTLADITINNGYTWSESTTSITKVGEYKFAATYTNQNYEQPSVTDTITVNVAPAEGSPTFPPIDAITIDYKDGLKLADIDLPPSYNWTASETPLSAGNGQTFLANYTNPNYKNPSTGFVTININQKSGQEPSFPTPTQTISTTYKEGLTLVGIDLPPGYSWVEPSLPIPAVGSYEFEATYALNYLQPIGGKLALEVSKNPGAESQFPAISVDAVYKSGLTLSEIILPSGYFWVASSTTVIPGEQSFAAEHENPNYAQRSKGNITVNVTIGNGSVTIENWVYGETPSEPHTQTSSNGAASLLYTGTTNSGASYSNAQPPTQAGSYTLTATFAAKDPYEPVVRTATFEIEKAKGTGAVSIDGWKFGSEASEPAAESETNGAENVHFIYRSAKNSSYAPQESQPSNPGYYMLIAVFPENSNYTEARDTTYFTISSATATELTVVWSEDTVFTYNKMVQYPVPSVLHNGTEIPLTLLNAQSEAGKYDGILKARAVIEEEATAREFVLKNNTKSYEILQKPLLPRFSVKTPADDFDANADTIWVPSNIFSDSTLLRSTLANIIDYAGFAKDIIKDESDNASVLSGTPRVELSYAGAGSLSVLQKRVETTQKATATIVTESVTAKNYSVSTRDIVVLEAISEADNAPQIFCKKNAGCASMSENSCDIIGGEVVPTCTIYCVVDDACAAMPVSSCTAYGGEAVETCPQVPVLHPQLSGSAFRVWQTASGVVSLDLGYMPAAPVALKVYDLKGKLLASGQVSTRYANIKVNAPSGVYLFRIGNRSAVGVVR